MRKIFGKHVSRGGDQVKPPDFIYAGVAALLIIAPSSYVVIYTNIQLFGVIFGIIVNIFYVASALNLVRLIKNCGCTEPGIVPAIPS